MEEFKTFRDIVNDPDGFLNKVMDEREKFIVVYECEALRIGCTKEEIERAKKSSDGLIKRMPYEGVNDGTVPVYIQKKLK